jgi:uncharacterized protein YbaP (TraB family)
MSLPSTRRIVSAGRAAAIASRRVARLWTAAGLLVLVLAACAQVREAAHPALAHINGHGLLWRIDADKKPPSYLFGTMHVSDPRVLALPGRVRQAFAGAKAAGFEAELTEGDIDRLVAMMQLPPERSLDQIIGPDLFEAVALINGLDDAGREKLKRFKPWAVAVLMESANAPTDARTLDDVLEQDAERQGKTVFSLESASEQLAVYDRLPEIHQVAYLVATLQSLLATEENRETELEADIRTYLARDTAHFYQRDVVEAMGESDTVTRTFLQDLIFARNRRFVERMVPWIERGGAFVAVGALHLPGDEGVVNLLRRRGYDVSVVY